jgi:hypothetical protein
MGLPLSSRLETFVGSITVELGGKTVAPRPPAHGGCWRPATVCGAGDENGLDGVVARITDCQCAGARRVQAGVAVFLAQTNDPLDGP